MSHNIEPFKTYENLSNNQIVYLADNITIQIFGQGKVSIKLENGQIQDITNVLHVPCLKKNLFFTKQLDLASGEIVIKQGQCTLKNVQGQTTFICNMEFDLYKLGETVTNNKIEQFNLTTMGSLNSIDLWHARLGHINTQRLQKNQKMVYGIHLFDETILNFCEPCIVGKQHRHKFPKMATHRAQHVLDFIDNDIYTMDTHTHIGYKYFFTFIDDYFRYKFFLLKHKYEVSKKFQIYKIKLENKLNK